MHPASLSVFALACGALALASCRQYEPLPLDMDLERQRWLETALDVESLADYAARLNEMPVAAGPPRPFDLADGLSLAEGEAVALLYNPELRALRARSRVALAGARNAGLWEDPQLDLDVLRIAKSVPDPWIAGGVLSFSIPISGRLGIEKELARATYGEAWLDVAIAEWQTLVALHTDWVTWSAAIERQELLRAYLGQLQEISSTAQQLASRGEIGPSDARVFQIDIASQRAELLRATATTEETRLALFARLGLAPGAPVRPVPALGVAYPVSHDEEDHDALLGHPLLRRAAAAYEVAEQQLRLEIARQYPDLTLGPAYENEDAQSRIGLGAGIPIPVLNRNRRGIAEAEASRDASRIDAERALQELEHRFTSACRRAESATAVRAQLEREVAPLIAAQIQEIRRLADLGELEALLLEDALSRSLEGKLEILATHVEEAIALAELDSLLNPRWIVRPEEEESPRD